MDVATIIGLLVSLGLIFQASGLAMWGDVPSLAIVIGGGIGASMAANPLPDLMNAFKAAVKAFMPTVSDAPQLIEKIVGFAETARREGILALESAVEEGDDPFLGGGIRLAVDGTEPDLIMEILETELRFVEERHKKGQEILSRMADVFPAFGMIGTLVGLVNMLLAMDDPAALGPAMSMCLLTTLYGAFIAQVICSPLAAKLKTYSEKEILIKQMIILGIMSIQSGDNPRIVEHKLSVFISPAMRPASEAAEGE